LQLLELGFELIGVVEWQQMGSINSDWHNKIYGNPLGYMV
jgi:hypothetical protein